MEQNQKVVKFTLQIINNKENMGNMTVRRIWMPPYPTNMPDGLSKTIGNTHGFLFILKFPY